MVEPFKTSFYCTFGQAHLNGKGLKHFVEVIAADSAEVHEAMYQIFKGRWSFCYDKKTFKGQAERWGLTSIGVIRRIGTKWFLEGGFEHE